MFIGMISIIIIGISIGVITYIQKPPITAQFGAVGSTHIHAVMLVMVNGKQVVNFAEPKYQLRSDYIHFENKDGYTLHMHATNVHLGYLFNTLDIEFNSNCLLIENTSYCNNSTHTLKMYVNNERNNMYDKYVFRDLDRILITYGPDDEEQINRELSILANLSIRG